MPRLRFLAALASVVALHAGMALAQAPGGARPPAMSPDTVLADNGIAKVTRADYDLELTRLPPTVRGGFATSAKRVSDLVNRLLVTRTLAILADQQRLLEDPETARRLNVEMERLKSQLMIMKVEREAGAAFDANLAPYEARARDLYRLDPRKYDVGAEVAVSHILFATPQHTVQEATRLATEARAALLGGADFGALARERSEDPSAKTNGGSLGTIRRGQTDPAFERAAFAMAKVGEISEPVRTDFGVHLIRLDAHKPGRQATFEEAKPRIMADLRQRYVEGERDGFLDEIRATVTKGTDTAKIESMVIRSDPAMLERAQRESLQRQQDALRERTQSPSKR